MKQLVYHIYFDRRCDEFIYHEFWHWYLGSGGDDYRQFKSLIEAEVYAKSRNASPVYW